MHAVQPHADPRPLRRWADHAPFIDPCFSLGIGQVERSHLRPVAFFDLAEDEPVPVECDSVRSHILEAFARVVDPEEESCVARLYWT